MPFIANIHIYEILTLILVESSICDLTVSYLSYIFSHLQILVYKITSNYSFTSFHIYKFLKLEISFLIAWKTVDLKNGEIAMDEYDSYKYHHIKHTPHCYLI